MRASPERIAKNILDHLERFKVFREMYGVREFRLVLCADVHDRIAVRATQALKCILEAERTKGGLDYLLGEPLVIPEMKSRFTRLCDSRAGDRRGQPVYATVL